jgi:hypothetical protein
MKADERGNYTWHPVLDEMDKQGISIMKFRSSRGKPRMELVEYVNTPCLKFITHAYLLIVFYLIL